MASSKKLEGHTSIQRRNRSKISTFCQGTIDQLHMEGKPAEQDMGCSIQEDMGWDLQLLTG
jgi:hypothetical protein